MTKGKQIQNIRIYTKKNGKQTIILFSVRECLHLQVSNVFEDLRVEKAELNVVTSPLRVLQGYQHCVEYRVE